MKRFSRTLPTVVKWQTPKLIILTLPIEGEWFFNIHRMDYMLIAILAQPASSRRLSFGRGSR